MRNQWGKKKVQKLFKKDYKSTHETFHIQIN